MLGPQRFCGGTVNYSLLGVIQSEHGTELLFSAVTWGYGSEW
jgi:hypothetical protein